MYSSVLCVCKTEYSIMMKTIKIVFSVLLACIICVSRANFEHLDKNEIKSEIKNTIIESDTDVCSPNPCLNDGYCVNSDGIASCQCKYGYFGHRCERVENPCVPNPCLNDGVCSRSGGVVKCRCKAGYTGEKCEHDICSPNPCLNGGYCSNSGGTARCMCKDGYTGDRCETSRDVCFPNPCLNGGYCSDSRGIARCTCRNGYEGDTCEIAPDPCSTNPCLNEGVCSNYEGIAKCICKTGYTGFKCEIVDPCASMTCKNGGFCIHADDVYQCYCKEFYGGADCSENIWCDKYGDDLCGKEKCKYDDKIGRGQCICEMGKIFNITTKTCTGGCSTYFCHNGGICKEEESTPRCHCRIPFTGERCENDPCTPNPCLNGGSCLVDGRTYKCICKELYAGYVCENDNRYLMAALLILVLFASVCLCRGCCVYRPTHNFILRDSDGYKTLQNMP